MVNLVEEVFSSLGSGTNILQPEEVEMANVSRKSLHAAQKIQAGTRIELEDLVLLRPGTGIMWSDRNLLIGRATRRTIGQGEMVLPRDLA